MKILETITPENVPQDPARYRARCEDCDDVTPWFETLEYTRDQAEKHVRQLGHRVSVEDRDAS